VASHFDLALGAASLIRVVIHEGGR